MKVSVIILALLLALALCIIYVFIITKGSREERGGMNKNGFHSPNEHHEEREFDGNNDIRERDRDDVRDNNHDIDSKGHRHHHPPPPPDSDDMHDKDFFPKDSKPLCGGTKVEYIYNKSRLNVYYHYYENDSCSDESVLSINSTYFTKYKREKEETIREIGLHMMHINAATLNDKGIDVLKEMTKEYCENITITAGESIDLMKLCHKLVKRVFKTHIRGEYQYDDENNVIYLMTWSRKEMKKNLNSNVRVEDDRDEDREAKKLEPFECQAFTDADSNSGSLFDITNISNKFKRFMKKVHNNLRKRKI